MGVHSAYNAVAINYDIPVTGQIESADRIIEAFLGDCVRPINLVPIQDILSFRQVRLLFVEVPWINVDENHGQLVGAVALLHPLYQRESFDADVSGDAPDVEDERPLGQALAAGDFAVGCFERKRRAGPADNHPAHTALK